MNSPHIFPTLSCIGTLVFVSKKASRGVMPIVLSSKGEQPCSSMLFLFPAPPNCSCKFCNPDRSLSKLSLVVPKWMTKARDLVPVSSAITPWFLSKNSFAS
ncbi:hypothetical protein Scep_029232 [Stephania cephalantha]|uniref:Uncharacterized protein n=1 Tax=Stephania cephalantha TaxID=152367 RepID=A0AAP0DXF6_9MAGN